MVIMAAAACVVLASGISTRAQSAAVQVTAADARVFLSADDSSAVVTAVPVGAMLEVVNKTDAWYQVRLPKDSSGFDRVGYIPASKVKAASMPGRSSASSSSSSSAASSAAASAARRMRPTAAVLDFDFGTIENWWGGNWDIGKGIADMLVEELLQTGDIRLLERKQIQSVLGEQDLANSNRADVTAGQAAALGKVLGAKLLITGTVTKFGSEEHNLGGSAGVMAGRFFGGAGAKKTTANVALTARIIDSSTSEILASAKGEGKSNRKGLLLNGVIGGTSGGIDMNSSDFRETILGEATEKAVTELATRLTTALANATR
jgi:curli biogenesis system outer membrane secretion channel CsgG